MGWRQPAQPDAHRDREDAEGKLRAGGDKGDEELARVAQPHREFGRRADDEENAEKERGKSLRAALLVRNPHQLAHHETRPGQRLGRVGRHDPSCPSRRPLLRAVGNAEQRSSQPEKGSPPPPPGIRGLHDHESRPSRSCRRGQAHAIGCHQSCDGSADEQEYGHRSAPSRSGRKRHRRPTGRPVAPVRDPTGHGVDGRVCHRSTVSVTMGLDQSERSGWVPPPACAAGPSTRVYHATHDALGQPPIWTGRRSQDGAGDRLTMN